MVLLFELPYETSFWTSKVKMILCVSVAFCLVLCWSILTSLPFFRCFPPHFYFLFILFEEAKGIYFSFPGETVDGTNMKTAINVLDADLFVQGVPLLSCYALLKTSCKWCTSIKQPTVIPEFPKSEGGCQAKILWTCKSRCFVTLAGFYMKYMI